MLKSQKERIISKILERDRSIFISELQKNKDQLLDNLKDASILVIGGAGSIGSHYVLELLRYPVQKICIVDRDENALTKLSVSRLFFCILTMPSILNLLLMSSSSSE